MIFCLLGSGCHTLSCEGVSNLKEKGFKYDSTNVVIPSHVRALATYHNASCFVGIMSCHTLSCEGVSNKYTLRRGKLYRVVIPSHVRALATVSDDQKNFCASCHTLSCEGVSNFLNPDIFSSKNELSYPLM